MDQRVSRPGAIPKLSQILFWYLASQGANGLTMLLLWLAYGRDISWDFYGPMIIGVFGLFYTFVICPALFILETILLFTWMKKLNFKAMFSFFRAVWIGGLSANLVILVGWYHNWNPTQSLLEARNWHIAFTALFAVLGWFAFHTKKVKS